jgi:hypothetical protein
MLGWDRYGFDKKRTETRNTKLVFLHPVVSVGRVVHSGAFRARNINTLFFMFGWDRYGFDKKCAETRYTEPVFLDMMQSTGNTELSGASGE